MKPFQAFPGQDHRAHVTAHLYFMATNFVRNNPSVTAALEKNVLEHISLMAQEQVQLEFQQEFQMLPQLQQAATQNPQVRQQLQQISQKIEARKAVLIADMTEEFMKEEKTITSQFDHDPLLKLKQREVDLKAIEEERKIKEDDARINLDKTKLLQGQQLAKEKLQQNEELANLRADTSIEKSLISADVKLTSDQMKAKDVKTLKGPRS
jgi:transcriptional regulator NrdR family protein